MKRALLLAVTLCVEAAALPPVFQVRPPAICIPPAQFICGGNWGCRCQIPPPRPEAVTGPMSAAFYITHVVYSVPGRSSSMQYNRGDVVGSTTSTTQTWKNGITATYESKTSVLFATGSLSVSGGMEWGSSDTATVDIQASQVSGYRKVGEIDFVDHDDDEVWFLARPSILVTITPESSYGPAKVAWRFDPSVQPTAYFLYVGELRGTRAIPANVQAALDGWGITPAAYPEMLKADPFAGVETPATKPSPFEPTQQKLDTQKAGPLSDTSRFELLGTFPYVPVPAPGYAPSSQSYSVARKVVNTSEKKSDVTYRTSITFGVGLGFLDLAYMTMSLKDELAFTSASSWKDSVESNTANTITVGQPAFGYTGPTVLRVYEDKIWKTYVFDLDWY